MSEQTPTNVPKKQGFAALTPEQRREVAAQGGRSVKPENRTFSRSRATARKAGFLGATSKRRARKGADRE